MSVYVLPYNSTEQLSPHINSQELKCKCGGTHSITVNTDLIDRIEKLISIIADIKNVSAKDVHINISSANRCKRHDINVGGSGWGMHVVGKAMDFQITCKGEVIDTRLIACIAQEIGFNGIGRITSAYIHCDVGTIAEHGNKKWLGDEMVRGGTSGSIINEPQTYWNYYGLNRADYIKEDKTVSDNTNDSLEIKLQKILNTKGAKLTVDGIIGNLSLTELRRYTIEPNDSGELTKWTQEKLKSIGYDVDINGTADKKTMDAIHKFQKDNGLGEGICLSGGDWGVLIKISNK